jgi:hypothetical protein
LLHHGVEPITRIAPAPRVLLLSFSPGLPHRRALVVDAEHLGLDQGAEEIEIGMRV